MTRDSLRRISAALASVPSLGYAAAYLLCIPLFALFYVMLPDGFYHTTIWHEHSLDADEIAAKKALETAMRDTFLQEGRTNVIQNKSQRPLSLILLQFHDDKFTVMATAPYTNSDLGDMVEFSFRGRAFLDISGRKRRHAIRAVTVNSSDSFDVHPFFPPPDPDELSPHISLETNKLWLDVPPHVDNLLENYAAARNGFPSRSSGNYWRMLYLSVITITTVGYGDILPLTSAARFLTGLEAFLGILLIGLFLNALSYEAREHHTEAQHRK